MQRITTASNQIDVRAIVTHIISGDGINKCRICMRDTKDGQVHLEETVMMDGDKGLTLSEVLELVTGVEVRSDEDLPAGLCSACVTAALSAANFWFLCQRASKQWEITVKLLSSLPSRSKNITAAIIDNNNNELIIIDKYMAKSRITVHIAIDRKNITRKYKCTECKKEFLHSFQLYYHLKESSYRQACYVCGDVMLRSDLVSHTVDSHNQVLFPCDECPVMLLSQRQFKEHTKQAHAHSREGWKCDVQKENAKHTTSPINQPEKCTNCDTTFNNQPCFMYHTKNCHKIEKVQPNIKCSNTNGAVSKHPSPRSCICDYCGKVFAGKKFVSAHIQIVHLRHTHRPCSYCGQSLAAARMSEHVRRHLSVQSYVCDSCGVVLKTKLGYIQHMRLHTGEKPYVCEHCGESFSASSRRSEHMRQKHNPKGVVLRHACTLCPARFRLPYRLQKHLQSVHKNTAEPAKRFSCGDCEEKFETRRGFLHHNRRKHQMPKIWNKDYRK